MAAVFEAALETVTLFESQESGKQQHNAITSMCTWQQRGVNELLCYLLNSKAVLRPKCKDVMNPSGLVMVPARQGSSASPLLSTWFEFLTFLNSVIRLSCYLFSAIFCALFQPLSLVILWILRSKLILSLMEVPELFIWNSSFPSFFIYFFPFLFCNLSLEITESLELKLPKKRSY